jgi:SNF2 family DNA or RNA helicase
MRLGPTGLIEVVCPFDAVTQAQLRALRPRGRWQPQQGCWSFPLEAAAELQRQLGSRFPLTPELATWFGWLAQPLPPLPPHRQLVAAAQLDQPLADGRRLLRHQRLAVRWLLARRGAVLADAMGLGKTLSALAAARALARLGGARLVVVAPVGLHHHWRQEAAALELHLELHSWARLPAELPPAGTILIVDEAHYAQSLAAARTRALLRLARHPRLRAIWMLSGTPMKNGRPAQLFPLLAAIGHPLAQDQHRFEELYCGGHWRERGGRRIWQASGATRLDELRRLVRPLLLHRRKDQCLDLPPKRRHCWPVQLDADQAHAFELSFAACLRAYRQRAARGQVRRDAEALAMLTALRRLGSRHKVPSACALVERLLADGEPVVLFTAFLASAAALHRHFAAHQPLLLTGRLAAPQRQAAVDRFQAGDAPLLIATFGTGGLGFSLHRGRHVVMLERPWTPGDAEQAEDRCHRIGMGGDGLTSHWLQLGVADQLVDGLIATKAEHIAVVLQGRRQLLARRSLPQMVRQWLDQA